MNIVIMVRTIPLATFVFSSRRLVQKVWPTNRLELVQIVEKTVKHKTNILFVFKMDHNLSQKVAVVDRVVVH